jgi:formylglycine-generating enzyme required for sulfatase activity
MNQWETIIMRKAHLVLLIAVGILRAVGAADPYTNPADINNDQTVDAADLAIFIEAWLSTEAAAVNWNPACDIAQPSDGVIDARDFSVLTANWRWRRPEPITRIPAGLFTMGDHFAEDSLHELPLHDVWIDTLYIGTFEITNRQYCDFLNSALSTADIRIEQGIVYPADGAQPYFNTYTKDYHSQINYSHAMFSVRTKNGIDMSDHPVVEVSWFGAAAYCNWRSAQQQLDPCYDLMTWQCDFSGSGYRLPTEAEWEYLARGGLAAPYTRYPWGDAITGANANYQDSGDPFTSNNPPQTTPIGYYNGNQSPIGRCMANGYGLFDTAGNVWEWCNDFYAANYYASSPCENPIGPQIGAQRVLRGGGYSTGTDHCRVSYRYYDFPDMRWSFAGFRIVRTAE